MKVAAISKKQGDGEPGSGPGGAAKKLLHGLIENEIHAGLVFAAVARTAYRAAKFSEGAAALSKAEAIYVQASELAHDNGENPPQAFADGLRELRESIDDVVSGELGR